MRYRSCRSGQAGASRTAAVEKKQKKKFHKTFTSVLHPHPKKLRDRERELAVSSHLSLYFSILSKSERERKERERDRDDRLVVVCGGGVGATSRR